MTLKAGKDAKLKMGTGVLTLPLNSIGQYLLTLRNSPKTPQAHHKWQITGGGMEFGETPEETLIRECQEEIDVTPTIIYPHPIVKTHVWKESAYFHVTLITFLVDIGNQKIIPDEREVVDYKWYFPDEIKQLKYLPLTYKIVRDAEKIRTQFLKNVATI